jgi:hypothetical protein
MINPEEKQVQSIFVAGPAGSGKSVWTYTYACNWRRAFPSLPIYFFSRKVDDLPMFSKLKEFHNIPVTEELWDDEQLITPETLSGSEEGAKKIGCLCIFDDVSQIESPAIKSKIRTLRTGCLELGRSQNIWSISTEHQLTNWSATRSLLNESSDVVFFPKKANRHELQYFLKTYQHMGKEDINKIMNVKSRSCILHKNVPSFILTENECWMLSR